jgi:hypothetical protein
VVVRRVMRCFGVSLILGTLIGGYALSQSGERSWVSLDGSKEGTPADVLFDARSSNASTSSFAVVIHGFWAETKKGPTESYAKIVVPGLGAVQDLGAPSLPALRVDLAVPGPDAAVKVRAAEASETRTYNNVQIWPNPVPETDQEGGKPEQFMLDEKIYAQKTAFPGSALEPIGAVSVKLGSIHGATVELHPVQWNPATKTLQINRIVRYVVDHSGEAVRQRPMTKDRANLAAQKFLNWRAVSVNFPINVLYFQADFLFIYPVGYDDELQPLIDQKKARGFSVTELTTQTTGNTCNSIRTAINNWYNSQDAWSDKYALLVGDVNEIPLCTSADGTPTDDLYASTNGDDLDEEIFLGRLSVDSQTDAANQVGKILAYSDHPSLFCCYDEVLLVAHKEDAPGKYVGAHESVRTASYAVPPSFSTLYGNAAGVNNADVSAAINNGLGLVAYRGHGSDTAWTFWNLASDYYDTGDVGALTNTIPRVPVVWSFACDNSKLTTSDSIAEYWMESTSSRAVSHYGATIPSFTTQNHELDRRMFKAVYDLGLTTQSHAIQYAEDQMSSIVGSANAWMYLLLGDPDMQIRRRNPLDWVIKIPEYLEICRGPGCYLNVSIFDKIGNPVQGARVAVWKAGKEHDEVFNNRYTDGRGEASILVNPTSAGKMYYSIKDEAGNTQMGVIKVQ